MIDIATLAENLERRDDLWVAKNRSDVHYPAHGSDVCFEIEDISFWFAHRNRCVASICQKHLRDRVLFDIGGGNGFVSMGLQEAGFETVLVEPSISAMANALQRGIAHRVCAAFDDAGFRDNALPNIGLFDVLEHVAQPLPFLRGLRNALGLDGRLVLTVPTYGWLWSYEDVIAHHHRRYTRRSLKLELEQAGFQVIESMYFFSFLPLPILAARALPWRLGLLRDADATRTTDQHRAPGRLSQRIVDALCTFELGRIDRGVGLPCGSSILAVARK